MKRTCHCGDDGDEIVFGACRRCCPESASQSTLPKLVPSSWFVVPTHAPTCPLVCCTSADDPAVAHGFEPEPHGSGLCICGRSDDHDIHWPQQAFVPAEEPVLRDPHDLDDDERRGF